VSGAVVLRIKASVVH